MNDHDPKPLYYQFQAEQPGEVHVDIPRVGARGLAGAYRPGLMISRRDIVEILRQIVDPEMGLNVVDTGLIYGIDSEGGRIKVVMTMTTPVSPPPTAADHIEGSAAGRSGRPGVP